MKNKDKIGRWCRNSTHYHISFRGYTYGYSTSKQYNDKVKGFNDKFILPFINEIEGNYERICIEMGLDDNTNFFITNNGVKLILQEMNQQ